MLKQVSQEAKKFLMAKASFDQAYLKWWHGVKPCNDSTAYRLLEAFRKEIASFYFGYKRYDVGIKQAADELFRLVAVGEANWTYEDLCGFSVWYDDMSNHKLGRPASKFFEYHGDSFADFCDSLPLAGKDIVTRCLNNRFCDLESVGEAIEAAHGKPWRKLICSGENYVDMTLARQAKKRFVSNALRESEKWTKEEQDALEHLTIWDD